MEKLITGLHHVTALASDPQRNVDFYAGILGTRLVKRTVNFDAPEVYHLYYGDETGSPGTILTFFPYAGMQRGRSGLGQLTTTAFAVPEQSLGFWMERLKKYGIAHSAPQERFGTETFISFTDHDGLGLELVAVAGDTRPGYTYGQIPLEYAIRGFHSVALSEQRADRTAALLEGLLDHTHLAQAGNRTRYTTTGRPGDLVDILELPAGTRALQGAGTVHHLAFATASDATQALVQQRLAQGGVQATPVQDRQYFHSIYFREPGGVLFEVATANPGFAIDEEVPHLGEALRLPSWQERNRPQIEAGLTPITFDWRRFA